MFKLSLRLPFSSIPGRFDSPILLGAPISCLSSFKFSAEPRLNQTTNTGIDRARSHGIGDRKASSPWISSNLQCSLCHGFAFLCLRENQLCSQEPPKARLFFSPPVEISHLCPHRRITESVNWTGGGTVVVGQVLTNPTVACAGIQRHEGFASSCGFLKAHRQCSSGGFVDYISFFYCGCEKLRVFGFAVLGIWLAALFYMLGNTAAGYFCCSLERLSNLLKLPPTVAGVALFRLPMVPPTSLLVLQLL